MILKFVTNFDTFKCFIFDFELLMSSSYIKFENSLAFLTSLTPGMRVKTIVISNRLFHND